ncbi:hypothetical protein [Litorilituus lipolyticus]|uniref:Uncharacterized protein n=1 Tax=Litorilituus lipolyticus TaxID=2491017 RepID=A0A502KUI2_9GAMM|nr:hypothetical protein [Litorilituus lipolyticus]TPH15222.1 hypothetical protein EPA86_10440 [Litorilituus lipolyticus]
MHWLIKIVALIMLLIGFLRFGYMEYDHTTDNVSLYPLLWLLPIIMISISLVIREISSSKDL